MRVIGASWGRTGTTTAAAALDQLGLGPCLQMQTMWQRPDLAAAWVRAHAGAPTDWPRLLAGFGASVDWPGCWQWREFSALWPEAVVLLTVRDPLAWHESVLASIHAWTAPGVDRKAPPSVDALLDMVWDESFGSWKHALDRDHAVRCYTAHVADVRSHCPPERLLEWSVADGWEPLCAGLGLAVPDTPLPHLNRR